MAAYRILGITDETTTCECCGRANLKKTVVITDGEVVFRFGSECAAKRLATTKKLVDAAVKTIEMQEAERKEGERRRKADEEYGAWAAFLSSRCPGLGVSEAVKALGGFAAARVAYKAV